MKILIEIETDGNAFKINGVSMTKLSRDIMLGNIISVKLTESKKIKYARMIKVEEE